MKKAILPFVVLLIAGGITAVLIYSRPKPESRQPEVIPTPVQFMTAESSPTTLYVHSQGTVFPDQQATVATEVAGLVVEVSPQFETGKFVKKGDLLLRLDPSDYEAAEAEARANLLSARTSLIQAEADAEQAIRDLKEVGVANPSPLARREPQLEQARLRVDSAQAAYELAGKNLDRTHLRAPFDGQIVETLVDLGDVLSGRGTPVGQIYGTNLAEVRLPLSRRDLVHLALPANPGAGVNDPTERPEVLLYAGSGQDRVERTGYIDRLEGTTDPVTRLRNAVARFKDPLNARNAETDSIAFGSFVEAKIEGLHLEKAYRIPVVALVGEDRLRLIDSENRLQETEVAIFQRNGSDMVITGGLTDGDLICLTPLEVFIPGMPVRPINDSEEDGSLR